MLTIFPLIFCILVFLYLIKVLPDNGKGLCAVIREAFVWTALIAGLTATLIIEILSIFKAIVPVYVSIAWLCVSIAAGIAFFSVRHRKFPGICSRPRLQLFDKSFIGAILFVIALTFVIALLAPPNNFDAMTYHMARVAHWAQNHSVLNYPTHILHQLYMPPGAEFFILNFQVLLGSDHLANFVQWLAMIGSIITVTLLVKSMRGGARAQIISAFIASTIPMGIMQSTSTQNDYLTAFWLLCLALFVVKSNHENDPLNVIGAGLSLGLAVLTKATAYFFAAPFVLWLFVIWFRKDVKNFWKPFLFVLLIVVALNSGLFLRNMALFHSPLGPHSENIQSETHSPGNIVSNIVKYFSLNLNTPSNAVNRLIYTAVADFHHLSKVDINDRRTSAYENYSVETYIPHEDLVGNPMHLFLIIICGFALLNKNVRRGDKELLYYFSSVVAGFLLFFVLIKYQPWLNRLMLPVFLLFSPIIGIIMNRILSRATLVLILIIVFLVAIPPLVFNIKKPLITPPFVPDRYQYSIFTRPRQYFYFAGKPETYQCYKKIAEIAKKRNYSQIGVEEFRNEYPLWIMLEDGGRKFRLEHVGVTNISKEIKIDFVPSAVVCFGLSPEISQKYAKKYEYREQIGYDSFGLLVELYGR